MDSNREKLCTRRKAFKVRALNKVRVWSLPHLCRYGTVAKVGSDKCSSLVRINSMCWTNIFTHFILQNFPSKIYTNAPKIFMPAKSINTMFCPWWRLRYPREYIKGGDIFFKLNLLIFSRQISSFNFRFYTEVDFEVFIGGRFDFMIAP